MTKIRNYFIIMASVFAITSACALVGVQDVKADDAAMSDLIKRIEALESKPSGGNVVAPKIRGLKMFNNGGETRSLISAKHAQPRIWVKLE